jgi:hypothetical protein
MVRRARRLIVLGCSETKVDVEGVLPAISLYDGPLYRVLRTYLREFSWPESLSVAVLSAKHGLIGGVTQIGNYNQRMTPIRAQEMTATVNETLLDWGSGHDVVDFVLGKDYVQALDFEKLDNAYGHGRAKVVEGGIGIKQHRFHEILRETGKFERPRRPELRPQATPLYFLPDWDDFIDPNFDYVKDEFSAVNRSDRKEQHTIALMQPERMCDGILVSLAQHRGSKGLLRRMEGSDPASLAPQSVREHFGLASGQWAFGDCGAFSYVSEDEPTVTVEQAVALYELYQFDLGASVDHIPVAKMPTANGLKRVPKKERARRLKLTADNAEKFLQVHRDRAARFIPVGVVQGLVPKDYAEHVAKYVEMGYQHLAIGGLVPRGDDDIRAIVEAIDRKLNDVKKAKRPWIHLLGIFRPALQPLFKELHIGSFDSASYFRKAWLRSDQNYLGADGKWYAAIRVPPLHDARTRKRLAESELSEKQLRRLEKAALSSLRAYASGSGSLERALKAVTTYDKLLSRADDVENKLVEAYRSTLEARAWEKCECPRCKALGIDILIFRGKNRNKSRGAHNTLMLYCKVRGHEIPVDVRQ